MVEKNRYRKLFRCGGRGRSETWTDPVESEEASHAMIWVREISKCKGPEGMAC